MNKNLNSINFINIMKAFMKYIKNGIFVKYYDEYMIH